MRTANLCRVGLALTLFFTHSTATPSTPSTPPTPTALARHSPRHEQDRRRPHNLFGLALGQGWRAPPTSRDVPGDSAAGTAVELTGGHAEMHACQQVSAFPVKSLVYGGLDGIITTFALVCAAVGASLPHRTVVIMGLANLVADGISMGLGDALSEKAEIDLIQKEYSREQAEMRRNPEGELAEMVALYQSQGVPRRDATSILKTMIKYPEFFVRHMMNVELELQLPSGANPWVQGAVTFGAFATFGALPLASFVLFAKIPGIGSGRLFNLCIVSTACAIFILGAVEGSVTGTDSLSSGAGMLLNGGLAAVASYTIGWSLERAVPAQ